MDDYDRPPRNPAREDLRNRAWREGLQDRASVIGPMIALGVALMLGLIMIANMGDAQHAGGRERRTPGRHYAAARNVTTAVSPRTPLRRGSLVSNDHGKRRSE